MAWRVFTDTLFLWLQMSSRSRSRSGSRNRSRSRSPLRNRRGRFPDDTGPPILVQYERGPVSPMPGPSGTAAALIVEENKSSRTPGPSSAPGSQNSQMDIILSMQQSQQLLLRQLQAQMLLIQEEMMKDKTSKPEARLEVLEEKMVVEPEPQRDKPEEEEVDRDSYQLSYS